MDETEMSRVLHLRNTHVPAKLCSLLLYMSDTMNYYKCLLNEDETIIIIDLETRRGWLGKLFREAVENQHGSVIDPK